MKTEIERNANLYEFKELGINEVDIKECNSKQKLLDWKVEIDNVLLSVSDQITLARIDSFTRKNTINGVWHRKALSVKRIYGVLSQLIQRRLSELKEIEKFKNVKNNLNTNERFIKIARLMLSQELFQNIMNLAEREE